MKAIFLLMLQQSVDYLSHFEYFETWGQLCLTLLKYVSYMKSSIWVGNNRELSVETH